MHTNIKIADKIKEQLIQDKEEILFSNATNWVGIQDDGEHSLGGLVFDIKNCPKLGKATIKIMLTSIDIFDITIYDEKQIAYANLENIYLNRLSNVIKNLLNEST
jgi:hypothetical protein